MTEPAEHQEHIEDTPPETTPEDKARALGWRPKDEYKGRPDKWVDVDAFLIQSEEDLPRIRKENHKLLRDLEKTKTGVQEILAHQQRQIDAAREEAYAKAKEEFQTAVASGDIEAADAAFERRKKLEAPVQKPKEEQASEEDAEVLSSWLEENDWFGEYPHMANLAREYESGQMRKGVPLKQRLEKTAAYIKRQFPHEFQENDMDEDDEPAPQPKRKPGSAAIIKSNSNGVRRPVQKAEPGSYEALTSEAKVACDRSIKMSGGKITKEAWLQYATEDMFNA